GIEVVSGIILGLDTDTPETGERLVRFIERSSIPMLTINLLHALPRTPLWRRLEEEVRIVHLPGRESNVELLLPYDEVEAMWRESIREPFRPEAFFDRFDHQVEHTYPNRKQLPVTRARLNAGNILRAISILARVFWHVGLRSHYRRRFWRTALPNLRKLKIEEVIHGAVVGHHMIRFAEDCLNGTAERSFYSPAPQNAAVGELAKE